MNFHLLYFNVIAAHIHDIVNINLGSPIRIPGNTNTVVDTIDDVTAEMLQQTFGPPFSMQGDYDPYEYGGFVDDCYWFFISEDGQVIGVEDRRCRSSTLCLLFEDNDPDPNFINKFVVWVRNATQKFQPKGQKLVQVSNSNGFRRVLVKVAGVSFDNRQDVISRLSLREVVRFRRDRWNPHDSYAVRVETLDGQQIGFIPQKYSYSFSLFLHLFGNDVFLGWVEELKGGSPNFSNRGVVVGIEIPPRGTTHTIF